MVQRSSSHSINRHIYHGWIAMKIKRAPTASHQGGVCAGRWGTMHPKPHSPGGKKTTKNLQIYAAGLFPSISHSFPACKSPSSTHPFSPSALTCHEHTTSYHLLLSGLQSQLLSTHPYTHTSPFLPPGRWVTMGIFYR